MLNAFICYARTDLSFVERLSEALNHHGIRTFIDAVSTQPGEMWLEEIHSSVKEAAVFIYVISPDSVGSQVTAKELDFAALYNKKIIPVVYRDVEPERVPPSIAQFNWILLREADDFDLGVRVLAGEIRSDPVYIREHTRLLQLAVEWHSHNRRRDLLLTGESLGEAEAWLTEAKLKEPSPSALQLEFIVASQRATARYRVKIISVFIFCTYSLLLNIIFLFKAADQPAALSVLIAALLGFGISVPAVLLLIGRIGRYTIPRHPSKTVSEDVPSDISDELAEETLFVSYSRRDWESFVKPLVIELRRQGLKAWTDQSYIRGGQRWMDEIDKALNTCGRMILCVSPHALSSEFVKKEYRLFLSDHKMIIPVICEEAKLPFEIHDLQYLPYGNFELLLSALASRASLTEQAAR